MSVKPRFLQLLTCAVFMQALALASWAQPAVYLSDTRAYNLAHGRVVFQQECMRCHESGRKGAPVFGDIEDWEDRLAQTLDTLIQHAIDGHGDMPARGDRDVNDADVADAVAYVVNRTRTIAAEGLNALPPPAAGKLADQTMDASDQAAVHMFFMLLGQDRWK